MNGVSTAEDILYALKECVDTNVSKRTAHLMLEVVGEAIQADNTGNYDVVSEKLKTLDDLLEFDRLVL